MKSPFTGKEMKRIFEKRIWKFRGEEFEYYHSSWLCEETNELFTTDESDDAGFIQVTNQYREKYGIPYADEIIAVREKYGISAAKMAQILGFGINQYRLYEQGEVPNVSNGRIIRSITNPKVMLDMVESSRNIITSREYIKITAKVMAAINESAAFKQNQYETQRIFCSQRGAVNGYAQTSLVRLKNIMFYILNRCNDVWCTKMNKLLFYIDFLSYRERGFAMSGLVYKAIDFGPVPERWDRVYSGFAQITQNLQQSGDFVGSVLHTDSHVEEGVLSADDIKIIDMVCDFFADKSSREISQISHTENAWLNNSENHNRIPFVNAFSLKAI